MSLSAVLKYMAKQGVDCRNMVVTVVWHTHTAVWLLKNYIIIGCKIHIILVFYHWIQRTVALSSQYFAPYRRQSNTCIVMPQSDTNSRLCRFTLHLL